MTMSETGIILAAAREACLWAGCHGVDGRCLYCREYVDLPETLDESDTMLDESDTDDSVPCPYYTVDQGCPLHGEYCSG